MFERILSLCVIVVLPIMGSWCPCSSSTKDETKTKTGSLGAETRNPTEEDAKTYGLAKQKVGCINGQYVTEVKAGGAADKAGLKQGDVILSIAGNKLYSRDDLLDVLRVGKPGATVEAQLKRAGSFKDENVKLTFDAGPEAAGKAIVWQYAGLGQLDRALAAAKKEGKVVLVGLSGADT